MRCFAAAFALAGSAAAQGDVDTQAEAACKAMNLTAKLGMMRGYGTVEAYSGYSRNSGCTSDEMEMCKSGSVSCRARRRRLS